jgi:membrane protease YdiL (CAAX protease family)
MPHPDYLSQRFNLWFLLLFGVFVFILYQVMQVPFVFQFTGVESYEPRSGFWIALGILIAGLAGVVLPLLALPWGYRIPIRAQYMIAPPRLGAALAVIAATLSIIPILEIITVQISRILPPSESYLLFLERMRSTDGMGSICLFISLALVVPFAEELLFRGFLQRLLSGWMGGPGAIVLVALLFGVVHPPYSIPGVILLGLFFGCLVYFLGNLLYPVIGHATWNLANLAVLKMSPASVQLPPESPFSAHPWAWGAASVLLFVFFTRLWLRDRLA